MTMKLVGIGGMGLMLSPSAKHLKSGGPARFLRIHDRGTKDHRRDMCRQAWKEHGADIVHDYEALLGDGDYDGVAELTRSKGVIGEQLQADLDRLTAADIPVDITFQQGPGVLGIDE